MFWSPSFRPDVSLFVGMTFHLVRKRSAGHGDIFPGTQCCVSSLRLSTIGLDNIILHSLDSSATLFLVGGEDVHPRRQQIW